MTDFLLVTSATGGARTGNRCTARQWAAALRGLGHRVEVVDRYAGQDARVLVALHARRGNGTIRAFRDAHPDGRVVVALTGTDIYPEPGPEALDSMARADRIVALQPRAQGRVPDAHRDRVRVIVQAAPPPPPGAASADGRFDVGVVAHLRAVKDPLRAAAAARLLPAASRVRVRHAGALLDPAFRQPVERERKENPRYLWLGELSEVDTRRLLAASRVSVVSSRFEGGARVVGESVVAGTPVLAARNDATRALLGDDYPGLFAPGDTRGLADLLRRAETDPGFLAALRARTREAAAQFDPRREVEAWRDLAAELGVGRRAPA